MPVLGEHIFKQSLYDRCFIDTRTAGNEWGSGRGTIAYTDGGTLTPCRVIQHKASELPDKSKVNIIDAAILFPASATLAEDDRIRVTLHARRVVSIVFAVVSVEREPWGIKAHCKQAKGGTAQ